MKQSDFDDRERLVIASMVDKMREELHKSVDAWDKKTQLSALINAQAYLREMEEYSLVRTVIDNFDDLRQVIDAKVRVLPVIDAVEKSHKAKFTGNEKSELSALQDAMWEVRVNNVTNEDFKLAGLLVERTGEILTIERILKRCAELGWQPPP